MITTLLAFIVTLGVLIVIHEYGHYRVAVACGVRVLRFSVGFGRVLWRRQRSPDDTEFVVCALPLGGYVRMLDEREDDVPAADRERAFNRKPLGQRAAIVAAGPAANLALAVCLYAMVHWIGLSEPKAVIAAPAAQTLAERAGLRSGDWIRAHSSDGQSWTDIESMTDLRWQVTQAVIDGRSLELLVSDRDGRAQRRVTLALDTVGSREVDSGLLRRLGLGAAFSEPVMGEIRPGGAAERAGLLAGDRVLEVDGRAVPDGQRLRELIRSAVDDEGAVPMRWRVQREGRVFDVTVTPALVEDGRTRIGRIEAYVGDAPETVTVRHGFVQGLGEAVAKTWEMSALTVQMLGRMLVGEASLKNLSGPVTIADYAGKSVQMGIVTYLGFLAVVSISLGVLNLLPLPMLDGGHLMYYLFEAVTGRPVSEVWLDRLQRGGIVVLTMMMSIALFNDVARLLGLH
ncbi:MAG: RIP metalloprotease RseP [Ideonella sp.]|jgi:regulator of sigma E protease|nr:RIP metalloprotease RseP [Ideonella sp.]